MSTQWACKEPRVPLGGDGDLDKAEWLKNKYMKLRLAACQPSQVDRLGILQCLPLSRTMGNPEPLSLTPRIPAGAAQGGRRHPRPPRLPLVLLQHPAPALPGGVGRGVTPSRAVQPQLLAPAETLGAGIDLHPRCLCTGLEKGSVPGCHLPPTHGARHHPGQGPTWGRAYPGRRARGRRWQCRGRCVPRTRTGPRPPAARG